ncbi:hypothetical protein B0H34DRAFT_195903 [Crassisporium funariophilum]|nr:hypothetical protein B0H34DRAFT_195903 [Crassisporium funariophilum]
MGGDHKCPVCQATFTRPQHVARHMRSHTGDRPYKCQYCGDQFARSDLLSRHVNKCHANEKPLPNIGARRKGSASASRATSSKQACDQCVQSSLPCDGCNPCSKCVQRKCRCTYVKFHRQTAPAGPGHNPRPTAPAVPSVSNAAPAASVSSRVPMYQQPEDDFILGPAPTAVPTMAEALYNSNSFAFPPLYPSNDISGDNADYSNKYRTQAELFGPGRSGLSTGLTPNLYDPRPSSSWLGWDQQETNDNYQQHQRHPDLIPSQNNAPPSSSSSTMNDKNMQQQPNSSHYMNVSVPYPVTASGYLLPSSNNNSGDHDRRGSVDFNDSDGSTASHSMPSSAASSSVHLPLDNMSGQQRQQQSHGIYNVSCRFLSFR